MGERNHEPSDEHLLNAVIETLLAAATPEQHRDNIVRLLRHFLEVHRTYDAPFPAWLEIGIRRFHVDAQDPPSD